jgi:hypothetical protein
MNLTFSLLLLLITFKQVDLQNDEVSILNRKITLEARQETIRTILKQIEKQVHLGFTYDSKIIDPTKKRTVSFKKKTISEVISILFDSTVKCKVKGNYIILYKDPGVPTSPVQKNNNHTIKKAIPKSLKNGADTSTLYYIDMIVPGFSGKDSVVRTDSIKVPASHFIQIKDDTTILIIKKGTGTKPK